MQCPFEYRSGDQQLRHLLMEMSQYQGMNLTPPPGEDLLQYFDRALVTAFNQYRNTAPEATQNAFLGYDSSPGPSIDDQRNWRTSAPR